MHRHKELQGMGARHSFLFISQFLIFPYASLARRGKVIRWLTKRYTFHAEQYFELVLGAVSRD